MSAATGRRTLYWVNGSIPSWRVMLALHEKGLEFAAIRLKVMSTPKETRAPEYLALNPRGVAPTLVEADGLVVVESLAILAYLERCYPAPPLLPAPEDRPACARALARAQASECLRAAYRPLEALFRPPSELSPEALAAAIAAPAAVDRELALWEDAAAEAPFIAGPTLTLADCAFYPALAYQRRRGLALAGRFPALAAYEARMASRPAAARAHPEGWSRPPGRDLFALAASLARGAG
ncbi:MAG: glutathione S-transferase family protein [Nannocystaceae bacterium]